MADRPPSERGSPWAQRGFVLAAAFIAVLVLAGLGVLIAGSGDSDGTNNDPGQRGEDAARPAVDPDASVCGLPAGDQEIPAAPPEARWELVGTVAAPSAPDVGPGIDERERRLCFAHSPTGALFAAVNFIAVAGRSPNNVELLRELTVASMARDALLEQGAEASDPTFRMQVAGFRVNGYSKTETTIDLAFQTNLEGRLIHILLPLRWERGDWKTVIASRERPYVGEQLQDLSGYVPWSGA